MKLTKRQKETLVKYGNTYLGYKRGIPVITSESSEQEKKRCAYITQQAAEYRMALIAIGAVIGCVVELNEMNNHYCLKIYSPDDELLLMIGEDLGDMPIDDELL